MLNKSIIVSILSFAVSIITFLNQLFLAKFFGAGLEMDTYIRYSSVPLLLSGIVSSALSYYLTPHLIKEKLINQREFPFYTGKLFYEILKYSSLIFLLFCSFMLSLSFNHNVFQFFKSSVFWITTTSWITALLNIAIAFYASIMNTNTKFNIPIILSFLPYIGSIVFTITLYNLLGITAVALGIFSGTLIAFCIGAYFTRKNISFKSINLRNNKNINNFLKNLPIVCFAMLSFTIYQSIDSYWAPKLGAFNLSYLSYCQKIIVAIGTLVIVGPSTILIPRLTQSIAENRKTDFLNDIILVIKIVFALASLVTVIGSILSVPIIRILFERGKFNNVDTINISLIMPYMLIGMSFMLSVVMLYRAFFTIENPKIVAILGMASTLIYFILSGIGSFYLGIKGIAIAYSLTWLIIFLLSVRSFFKANLSIFFNIQMILFVVRQILILFFVALATLIMYNRLHFLLETGYTVDSFKILITCGLLAIILYLIIATYVIKQKEIIYLMSSIKSSFLKR